MIGHDERHYAATLEPHYVLEKICFSLIAEHIPQAARSA
jgi:hypothetical protein